MNANKAVFLIVTSVLICFASVAFSQPPVDPLLAKFNALPPDERHAALVKAAQTERVVEWYATLPVEHSKVLVEAFRQRYPFIEVKYTGAGGGRMVNRVVTEHRAGLNKFDVLGGTSTSHAALMKAGLIARNVTPVRKELRDGFMDAEGYRVGPFTYALVIGYNTRALAKEQRPKSYEELLEPKWKGQIGLEAAGYEWLYRPGFAAGLIPTNGDRTLIFAAMFGVHMGLALDGLLRGDEIDAGRVADQLTRLFSDGMPEEVQAAPVSFRRPRRAG